MIFGYIRVSSDRQTVENQRYEIMKFCTEQGLCIDGWIDETITGTQNYKRRKLGKLLHKTRKGDMIICSELSRLGRNLFMVMEILNLCMERGCRIWTIKDNYRLGDDINAKVLAFAFGLSAEIERNLIAQRTREALARKRSEGMHLGRPTGSVYKANKLRAHRYDAEIRAMRRRGASLNEISCTLGINRNSLKRYMDRVGI